MSCQHIWNLFVHIACKPAIKCLKVSVFLELKHHSGDFFIQVTPLFLDEHSIEPNWGISDGFWIEVMRDSFCFVTCCTATAYGCSANGSPTLKKSLLKRFPLFFTFFTAYFFGRLLFGRVPPLWSCSCYRTRTWPRSRRGWTQNCPAIVLLTCQMIFHLFLIRL